MKKKFDSSIVSSSEEKVFALCIAILILSKHVHL